MSGTVTNTTNTTSNTASTSSSSTSVNKNDFLKLLIAQMKNQDPLNPMDGTQYVAELAQFSSLEELQNMNDNMNTSINANYTLTQSINNTLAANMIGKDVKVTSSDVTYNSQTSTTLGYTLPSTAANVSLTISNSDGTVVRTISNLSTKIGDHDITWDFKDNNGSKLPTGTYTYAISATNSSGTSLTTSLYKVGKVDAINYSSSGTTLSIDGTDYSLSDVLGIIGSSTSSSGGN